MPAATAEMPKAVVRISVGSRPIETLAEFGIAHRAHGVAPDAAAQARERGGGQHGERERQERDAAFADVMAEHARAGNAGQAVPAAGQTLPFRRALLDDEAEGDGHHGEIRSAHAERRDREQHAGQSGDDTGDDECRPE